MSVDDVCMCSDGREAEIRNSVVTYLEDKNEINSVTDEITSEDEVTESDSHTLFMAQENLVERLSQGVQVVDDLSVVDIYLHEGIWACLDEGCNKDCHSVKWRENVVKASSTTSPTLCARGCTLFVAATKDILWCW